MGGWGSRQGVHCRFLAGAIGDGWSGTFSTLMGEPDFSLHRMCAQPWPSQKWPGKACGRHPLIRTVYTAHLASYSAGQL